MGGQEEWNLGTATAAVHREEGAITLRLRGAVTAMVIEALHLRLGRECCCLRRTVIIEPRALLLCTGLSAVEAARRGTPDTPAGQAHIAYGVAARRLKWARDFCLIMGLSGLPRAAFAVRQTQALPAMARQQLELALQ